MIWPRERLVARFSSQGQMGNFRLAGPRVSVVTSGLYPEAKAALDSRKQMGVSGSISFLAQKQRAGPGLSPTTCPPVTGSVHTWKSWESETFNKPKQYSHRAIGSASRPMSEVIWRAGYIHNEGNVQCQSEVSGDAGGPRVRNAAPAGMDLPWAIILHSNAIPWWMDGVSWARHSAHITLFSPQSTLQSRHHRFPFIPNKTVI